MDVMVLKTQQWLNATYGKYVTSSNTDDSRFNLVPENGQTGWPTIYGLTRALQIELGIEYTADNFGPGTQARFSTLTKQAEGEPGDNQYAILQGALWCKGYGVGATDITNHFYGGTEAAVIALKKDMGLNNPNGAVTVHVMKALLSMDAFVLVNGGDTVIRSIQQRLNRHYEKYIGLKPCDGLYGRETNTALIYALQAEEGLPTDVANGNFGPTTIRCCPDIPYKGVQTSYWGATYNQTSICNILEIFKSALYCNGYSVLISTGELLPNPDIDSMTAAAIKSFQQFCHIPVSDKADKTTWLSLLTSCGDPDRSAKACDCATILTAEKAAALKNNGYKVVGRYLTGTVNHVSKALTLNELSIIFQAGLRVFPIFEEGGFEAEYFTPKQGKADAIAAVKAAASLGFKKGTVIYFAVDFDAMDSDVDNRLLPYFKNISYYFTNHGVDYNVGIYAPRNPCTRLKEYAPYSFVGDMSTGFSGNLGYPMPKNWAFDQFSTVTVGNGSGQIEIDKNGYSGRDPGVSSIDDPVKRACGLKAREIISAFPMAKLNQLPDELNFDCTYPVLKSTNIDIDITFSESWSYMPSNTKAVYKVNEGKLDIETGISGFPLKPGVTLSPAEFLNNGVSLRAIALKVSSGNIAVSVKNVVISGITTEIQVAYTVYIPDLKMQDGSTIEFSMEILYTIKQDSFLSPSPQEEKVNQSLTKLQYDYAHGVEIDWSVVGSFFTPTVQATEITLSGVLLLVLVSFLAAA